MFWFIHYPKASTKYSSSVCLWIAGTLALCRSIFLEEVLERSGWCDFFWKNEHSLLRRL